MERLIIYEEIKVFLFRAKEVLLNYNGAENKIEELDVEKFVELIRESHLITNKLESIYEKFGVK